MYPVILRSLDYHDLDRALFLSFIDYTQLSIIAVWVLYCFQQDPGKIHSNVGAFKAIISEISVGFVF